MEALVLTPVWSGPTFTAALNNIKGLASPYIGTDSADLIRLDSFWECITS